MKTLVISDHFFNQITSENIEYLKWVEPKLQSLIGYDAILVDLTIKKAEIKERADLLYDLKLKLEKEHFLNKHNLILVVLCGSPNEPLMKILPDEEVYGHNPDDRKIPFRTYDFLQNIIPEYTERLTDYDSKHIYPIATVPVNIYLDRYKDSIKYLYYDYEPEHKVCIDITPLAKAKPVGNACTAFEYKDGKGLTVFLPSYDISESAKAFLLLLRICRSYFKKREGMKELSKKADESLPESVREAYTEALLCFNNDLFMAAMVMCRRTLEAITIEMGEDSNDKLWKRLDKLLDTERIDKNLYDAAKEIRDFGNIGAHFDKYKGKVVTEEAVAEVLDLLEAYFNNFPRLEQKVLDSKKRREI